MNSELDRLQNEVDYWYSVAGMYMNSPLNQDEYEYAKSRLNEAIDARERARTAE